GLGASGSVELAGLNGHNGFTLHGESIRDAAGISVSGTADVNGGGFTDALIGAMSAHYGGPEEFGRAYVVFGGGSVGGSGSIELASLNGSDGFVLKGSYLRGETGGSVSGAG